MATTSTKSVLNDSRQVERAVALIQLGARLQVLESETSLSYERLLRLYKEVAGRSPSKGQLPFSTDWFLTVDHHPRLAPGEICRQPDAGHDQMQQVRRAFRERTL